MHTKVSNFKTRGGATAASQFLISDSRFDIFQSYESIIAKRCKRTGAITLDSFYWDYSVTTGRYRNEFLGEGIAETRARIDSKEYSLKNLNK